MADSQKRPERPRNAAHAEDLEGQVFRAMRSLGWGMPQTDEEVEQAQAELEQENVELPAVLRDPNAVWNHIPHAEAQQSPEFASDQETTRNLARAAREGGKITPEIEARMRQDREEAEKQDGAKE